MASEPTGVEPLRALPDAASQIAGLVFALILLDPDGRVREVNYAAEILLGTSAKLVVGKPLSDIFKPLDRRLVERLDDCLVGAHDEALIARDIGVRASGREFRLNLTMSAVAGHPGWRVVTLSPLGHEAALSEEREPGILTAPSILAHEIRNPLSAIRGAAQLIARKLPHGEKPLARMITDEVDRIARLIDRMQQLGSVTTEPLGPCNPHEAIRAACATVRAGGMRGVSIEEEFDPSLPPVLANRDALEQVLINLISNARDAAAAACGSEGKIMVRTRYVSGSVFSAIRRGRAVHLPIEITVSDNGAGVDPALREKLFEPFVSSKAGGQGLGLALVRKLMRDMQGSISHERVSRAGLTHFRLHLTVPKPTETIA
jgi:two-component system nitrogen regulation sensor histidine kinase GlnL